MTLLIVVYILIFIISALILYAIMQIKLAGIEVKDFWSFIEANQILDKLYEFSIQNTFSSATSCILNGSRKSIYSI